MTPTQHAPSDLASAAAAALRDVPDFPRPGILFKDITPLLASPEGLAAAVAGLVAAAPEGIERLSAFLDDLHVPCTLVLAGVDDRLNEKGYIVPGLGDAGDRLYGVV